MTLVLAREIIDDAAARGVGIGAFNVVHLETADGLARASEAAGLPIILQISQNCAEYHRSLEAIGRATLAVARAAATPVAVHLDHAEDPRLVDQAISLGFGSVMFDASTHPYQQNVARTARVVAAAHRRGVLVEGELGEIGGKGGAHASGARTDPEEARSFLAATGVDTLAVAVGSSHAMAARTARLDLDLIRRLHAALDVPLVLHGSSGVPDAEIRAAISAGMTKINVSTHLNGFFTRGVRDVLMNDPLVVDSRRYVAPAIEAMSEEAARLLRLFASAASTVSTEW